MCGWERAVSVVMDVYESADVDVDVDVKVVRTRLTLHIPLLKPLKRIRYLAQPDQLNMDRCGQFALDPFGSHVGEGCRGYLGESPGAIGRGRGRGGEGGLSRHGI